MSEQGCPHAGSGLPHGCPQDLSTLGEEEEEEEG
eukprot:CAMPEP_0201533356 /NCGR_PEP_ID=MMETSP0161_2-20130828/52960_1 /ASSEMBLY_ACC=CAM_ASM_000251 /TAXON_ID=180227 /ORGANISM="Neoparamoeba aestuarina, Strain SoJaBio B1-5/56/2" /LENGTH=33 /DNA_ID= /DNA_START= /DNA_END= /DNA_ORIENTATION=